MTYNPDFRFDCATTPAKKEKLNTLLNYLAHYEIDKKRIIYLNESRTYVKESAELLKTFFYVNKIPKNCVALIDGGYSFFDQGNDVLLDLGFKTHEIYPASIHQYFNPNDNRLHGTSKQSWKNNVDDFSNDVNATLYLMHCLDQDIKAYSQKWFQDNLLNPSTDHVNKEIGIGGLEKSKFRLKCMEDYESFINKINTNN